MQEGKKPRRGWMKSTKYPNAGTAGITQTVNGKEEDIPNDEKRKTLKAAQKPRRAIQSLISK